MTDRRRDRHTRRRVVAVVVAGSLLTAALAGCSGSGGGAGGSQPSTSSTRPSGAASTTSAVTSARAGPARSDPAGSPPALTTPHPSPPAVPSPDHVVVVVEENRAAPTVLGNSSAPFIDSLARTGATFTRSYAETHPSEPNYLALFSGSTQGVTDDSCPHTYTSDNLAHEVLAAGGSFASYSQSLPSQGFTGCRSGDYVRKHAPWVNWPSVPAATSHPVTDFPTDFAALPALTFVIPDLRHDMHDGTVAEGDRWLQHNLSGYISWARTHNSLLILTFDEDDHTANNRIPTIFVGQRVSPGSYAERVDHYRLLRTIEAAFALPALGAAAATQPITDVWTR